MTLYRPSALELIRLIPACLFLAVNPWAARAQLYSQPWDGSGSVYSSQNETNGPGQVSTAFDNFTLSISSYVTGVTWVGGYYNPLSQGPITAFTLTFWSDNAGQPGNALATESILGTANETFLSNTSNSIDYSYSATLPTQFTATGGTEYWLSVVPDLAFSPQWGWATGTGGDGMAYQEFFGFYNPVGNDMAFTLLGGSAVPEPGPLLSVLAGVVSVGASVIFRRKRCA